VITLYGWAKWERKGPVEEGAARRSRANQGKFRRRDLKENSLGGKERGGVARGTSSSAMGKKKKKTLPWGIGES